MLLLLKAMYEFSLIQRCSYYFGFFFVCFVLLKQMQVSPQKLAKAGCTREVHQQEILEIKHQTAKKI